MQKATMQKIKDATTIELCYFSLAGFCCLFSTLTNYVGLLELTNLFIAGIAIFLIGTTYVWVMPFVFSKYDGVSVEAD